MRKIILAGLAAWMLAAGPADHRKSYPPVRVPVLPGVRRFATASQKKSARPLVKDLGGDWLFAADLTTEANHGASNYATALGNGRLSVEISPWAELTVLRWPSPIWADQLRYFTVAKTTADGKGKRARMQDDAPSADWKKYGRPYEPCPGLGSAGGFLLASGEVVWTGDPSWISSRAFSPEDSTVLVTTLTRPGTEVAVTDWLDPEQDLMVRRFSIQGGARRFFYHATFAPLATAPGEIPPADPPDAGFAAYFLPSEQVVVHFQPKVKDAGRLAPLSNSALTAKQLDAAFPEGGVFVAWGLAEPAGGFQVGADRCERPAAANAPAGGFEDAGDGKLSGSAGFAGPVDAALSADLGGGAGEVAVIIAAADSASKASALVSEARAQGMAALQAKAVSNWQAVSAKIYLPAAADPATTRVIRRSVLNLIQGQDRDSGGIVASISRQPKYDYDWPRDGSFFDLTLDLAGFPEAVTRHHAFYARTQYTITHSFSLIWLFNYRSPWFNPAGHWPPNLSSNGKSKMPFQMNPFEIDETGLLLWDFWRHERVLPEGERAAYIRKMRPVLESAVAATLRWVDVKKGWTKPAIEDDHFPPDATLHGVASVLTGLAAACDAGPHWGVAPEETKKWCAAAAALREGALARIADPQVLENAGWRGQAWSLWPAPLFQNYTEPGAAAIKARLAKKIEEKLAQNTPGFAYLGEEIFTLALADRKQGEYRELLEQALKFLTQKVPFPGTDCYGEATLWVDVNGEKFAQQRTSIPHLWNGVTVYLAAMAVYEPERFASMRPPAPGE